MRSMDSGLVPGSLEEVGEFPRTKSGAEKQPQGNKGGSSRRSLLNFIALNSSYFLIR
jgi:hypothetical protein